MVLQGGPALVDKERAEGPSGRPAADTSNFSPTDHQAGDSIPSCRSYRVVVGTISSRAEAAAAGLRVAVLAAGCLRAVVEGLGIVRCRTHFARGLSSGKAP